MKARYFSCRNLSVAILKQNDTAFLLVIAFISFAFPLTIFFSPISTAISAEDYVQVMSSVYGPTAYFPGSNRMGSVPQYLASLVNTPSHILLMQCLIRGISATLGLYILGACFLPRGVSLLAFVLSLNFISLLPYSLLYQFYLSTHPFASSLAFLVLALFVISRYPNLKGRVLCSFIFLLIAMYWSVGNLIVAISLIVTIYSINYFYKTQLTGEQDSQASGPGRSQIALSEILSEPYLKKFNQFALLSSVAGILNYIAMVMYSELLPDFVKSFSSSQYTKASYSIINIKNSLVGTYEVLGPIWSSALIAGILGIVLINIALIYIKPAINIKIAFQKATFVTVLYTTTALLYFLITSQLAHVKNNNFNFRYFSPSLLFLIIGLASFAAMLVQDTFKQKLGSCFMKIFLLILLFVPLMTICWRFPKEANAEPSSFARYAIAANIFNADFAVGSYWSVWPVVYLVNDMIATSNSARNAVFPTGYRAEVFAGKFTPFLFDRLARRGELRAICIPQGNHPSEFGNASCNEIFRWNQQWGVLPWGGSKNIEMDEFYNIQRWRIRPTSAEIGIPILLYGSESDVSTLRIGWYPPEAFGSWTWGKSARIYLKLTNESIQAKRLTIKIASSVSYFSPRAKPITASFYVDRVMVGKGRWDHAGGASEIILPLPDVGNSREQIIELEIRIDNPQSVNKLDGSLDNRQLGLAISSITLDH